MAYLPGKNLTVTVNSVAQLVQTSNLQREAGEVDYTNTSSSGEFEGGTDIRKTTCDFTVVVNGSALYAWDAGNELPASWAMTGGKSHSGTFIILNQSHSMNIRGAYTVQGQGTFTGTVTVV
jgi:hypothetical protein